ncbi:acyl-CoA reductase-like NAD-dependent aldehyde dehydrogenase [Bradyrhizobium sp. USDA 4354]
MKDMQAHLELLRRQIAECERMQQAATSELKRNALARLLARYRAIAVELEEAIAKMPPRDILLDRTKEARQVAKGAADDLRAHAKKLRPK